MLCNLCPFPQIIRARLSFLPRVDFEVSQHGMAQLAWLKKVSWSNDESFWGSGGGGVRISKLKWSQLAEDLKEKGCLECKAHLGESGICKRHVSKREVCTKAEQGAF